MFKHYTKTTLFVLCLEYSLFQPMEGSEKSHSASEVLWRIGAYDSPPYQSLVTGPNGTTLWTGMVPDLLLLMMDRFKMKYVIVPLKKEDVQKYGTSQAGINQLINDEVDIAPEGFVPSKERIRVMEFSFPVTMDSYRLLTPRPGEESRLFAFIGPFQSSVWIALFVAFLLMITLLSGMASIGEKMRRSAGNNQRTDRNPRAYSAHLNNFTSYLIMTMTNQGANTVIYFPSFRIVLASWLLAVTVLVYGYSSTLISFLTLPKYKESINTIEDLVRSKDIKVLLNYNSVLSQKILNASSGTYKQLGDKVRSNPSSIMMSASDIYVKMETMKFAYPGLEPLCYTLVASDLRKTGDCRYQVSDPLLLSQHGAVGLRKGGKNNEIFSFRILLLWESGLLQYQLKKGYSMANKCLAKKKKSTDQKVIQLVDLSSAYFILGVGVGLSVVCFLFEIAFHKMNKRR